MQQGSRVDFLTKKEYSGNITTRAQMKRENKWRSKGKELSECGAARKRPENQDK